MVSLSIIIPTCGRSTLWRTFESIVTAGIRSVDEVLVIGDGPQPISRAAVQALGHPCFRYLDGPETRCMGNSQRMAGLRQAKGSHLLFIDDDDAYRPGVLPAIASAAAENPGRILIYKMKSQTPRRTYGTLWHYRDPFIGNVGSPMFVIPNVRERLGVWGERAAGDFDFLDSTLAKWPGGKASIVWREEVIVDVY